MLDKDLQNALLEKSPRGRVLFDHPLREHSTISIGGSADAWCAPADLDELSGILAFLNSEGIRTIVLGNGSNTLMPDEGLRGVVINLSGKPFRRVENNGEMVTSGAGACLGGLIKYCCDKGLGGLEGLAGIPATVGGAACMNASYRSEVSERFVKAQVVRPDGRAEWVGKKDIRFGYRNSSLKGEGVITAAVFALERADPRDLRSRMTGYFAEKLEKQPLGKRTLGCVFKNPSKTGYSSGELIDRSGMKGLSAGGARVSKKHANFIVNEGSAGSGDVLTLISEVRERVREKFLLELEPEIEIMDNGA